MKQYIMRSFVDELHLLESLMQDKSLDVNIVRRLYIRSIFSAIEAGVIDWLESCCPTLAIMLRKSKDDIEAAKLAYALLAAREITFEIDKKGELVERRLKVPTQNKILFAINTLADCNGLTLDPKSVQGWDNLQLGLKIRNRITHPKLQKDLVISDNDYETCKSCFGWFAECTLTASNTVEKVFAEREKETPAS